MARANVMLLSGCALALVLHAGPVGALSDETKAGLAPEQRCESAKLEATSRYHRCVTYAYRKAIVRGGEPSDEQIARCDHRFDRAFEQAEANGACRTPGGASTLREPIEAQVRATMDNLATTAACTIAAENEIAVCQLDTGTSAVDLATLVSQLADHGVTEETAFWIQAWSGAGSKGNDVNEGQGGANGYAQTTTSLNALTTAYGTTELYHYVGSAGATRRTPVAMAARRRS